MPWAIAHSAYKRQRRNPALTETVKIPNRGTPHNRPRWREVAQTALDFLNRSLQGGPVSIARAKTRRLRLQVAVSFDRGG